MKKGLRSEKGSVTVFVLASCLFFLVSVIGVQEYTKNKQMSVEDDYRQIKLNYEKDIGNQQVIYENLKENESLGNITVNFKEQENYLIPTGSNTCVITQQFTIENRANKNIESISYGWSSNENTEPVNWEFISSQTLSSIARKTDATEGDYYLWVKVKHEGKNEGASTRSSKITVYIDEITIGKSSSKVVITYPSTVTLYNKKIGQGETEQEAKNNLVNNTNSTINISSKVLYVETTDSHGNKISKNVLSSPIVEASEYGKSVNYSVSKTNKWEIFYADGKNVYIITKTALDAQSLDGYISTYNGTTDFLDNAKIVNYPAIIDGWLYKTYANKDVIQSNENINMRATQYLLDSINVWDTIYKNNYGKWTIGAPTLEMLLASYKAVNTDSTLEIENVTDMGYPTTIDSGLTNPSVWNRGVGYWLACPSGKFHNDMLGVFADEKVFNRSYSYTRAIRPIVCLKSEVILTWNNNTNMYDLSM